MSVTNISQSHESCQQAPEQELRAAYHQLEEACQTHKLELPAELSKGNTEAANLANENLSDALQRFRDAEARTNYMLEDGRVICCQDYHGLKQLADGNRLPLEDVLKGCAKIADTRVLNLTFWSKNLTKLDGIEYMTELRRLELSINQIADVSPLANLSVLELLSLNENQIADLGPLAGLTALKWLYLNDNQIANIDPLVNLTALRRLCLYGLPHTKATSRIIRELEQRGVRVFC